MDKDMEDELRNLNSPEADTSDSFGPMEAIIVGQKARMIGQGFSPETAEAIAFETYRYIIASGIAERRKSANGLGGIL